VRHEQQKGTVKATKLLREEMMNDERSKKPDDQKGKTHEVVSNFGPIQVRSGFEIEQTGPGQMSVSIFGPFFQFLDDLTEDEPEGGEDQ